MNDKVKAAIEVLGGPEKARYRIQKLREGHLLADEYEEAVGDLALAALDGGGGEAKLRALLSAWTLRMGKELCPRAGYTDSFGDGVRCAKAEVAKILAVPPEQPAAPPPEPAPKCKTCDDTGTVEKCDWPGEHANRYQEPCPDCKPAPSASDVEARIADLERDSRQLRWVPWDRGTGDGERWMGAVFALLRELAAGAAEAERLSGACDLLQGDARAVINCMNRLDYPHHPEHMNDDEVIHRLVEMADQRADLRQKLAAAEANANAVAVRELEALRSEIDSWSSLCCINDRIAALRSQQPTPAAEKPETWDDVLREFLASPLPDLIGKEDRYRYSRMLAMTVKQLASRALAK